MIKVLNIFTDDPVQMAFTQNEYMMETFTSDTADEPFTNRIGLRCLHGGSEHLDAPVFSHSGATLPVLAVVVSDQKAGPVVSRN